MMTKLFKTKRKITKLFLLWTSTETYLIPSTPITVINSRILLFKKY